METVSGELVAIQRKTNNLRTICKAGSLSSARAMGAGDFGPYVRREEMERALAVERPDRPLGLLLRVLWQSGARISEALALVAGSIDFGGNTLRLRTLKRRKNAQGIAPARYRLVPVQQDLLGCLGQYLGWAKPRPDERLFSWTRSHAFVRIRRALAAAGVPPERCHPHAIRHGHAVAAILAGVPLPALQAQLDHASIATTSLYLKLTIEDRKAAYKGVF